jgi:secreted Zn-dependent insulinase-like peptidase
MQILCESSSIGGSKELHPANRFSYGNIKSLMGKDKDNEKLLKDLKLFFLSQYSSERMNLVV